MREKVELPDAADIEIVERVVPSVTPDQYRPFDYSGSVPPPLAPFGSGYRFHITGLLHDEHGAPTEDSEVVGRWWGYMQRKLDDHLDEILDWDEIRLDDAEIAIVAYGCTARSAEHAVDLARDRWHSGRTAQAEDDLALRRPGHRPPRRSGREVRRARAQPRPDSVRGAARRRRAGLG